MSKKVTGLTLKESTAVSGQLVAQWTAVTDKNCPAFKQYSYVWQYSTNGTWVTYNSGAITSIGTKVATEDIGDYSKVRFKIKPVQKAKKDLAKGVKVWTGEYVSATFEVSKLRPATPSAPDAEASGLNVISTYTITDSQTDKIIFRIQNSSGKIVHTSGVLTPTNKYVRYVKAGAGGQSYRVQARAVNVVGKTNLYSDWSEWSSFVDMPPAQPTGLTLSASGTTIKLSWNAVASATSYTVEYCATNKAYFNSVPENVTSISNITATNTMVESLEYNTTYYFRVIAVGSSESTPSEIKSLKLVAKPNAPTTWSSASVGSIGGEVTFNWAHSSDDGSPQAKAVLTITIAGYENETITFTTETSYTYVIGSGSIAWREGDTLEWYVNTYSESGASSPYSTVRSVQIYDAPALAMNAIGTLTTYPLTLALSASPSSQRALTYSVNVWNTSTYEIAREDGLEDVIKANTTLYSKEFNGLGNNPTIEIGAGDINLQDGEEYVLEITCVMNSGLSAVHRCVFDVAFAQVEFELDADVVINDDLSATIYATSTDSAIPISVYRRDVNGEYTLIQSGLSSGDACTDLHPALDWARYRLVGKVPGTNQIGVFDLDPIEIGEKMAVIQWGEDINVYDSEDNDDKHDLAMLKIPYNLSISDKASPDRNMVEYIGRKRPVAYFGTQLGETSTWSAVFKREDEDTLYKLRKLMIYQGNCYVREPSGTGYPAAVSASYDISADSRLVSVSFDITRVEE